MLARSVTIHLMRFLRSAILICAAASLLGCATRTETFDVSVRNDSSQSVIVWLTKTGGPEEEGWRSPESVAINFVVGDEPIGGVVVPQGKTAETGPRKAKMTADSRAVLRVYRGEMTMSDLLANGPTSPDRADVVLEPGPSRFVVLDAPGKLQVVPAGAAAAANTAPGAP